MPINTIEEARDEILEHITTAWNAQATPPVLLYADRPRDLPADAPSARITVQHKAFGQPTLGGQPSLGRACRRFRRIAILTVQIFTPFGNGLTIVTPLVYLVVDTT